ncbi:hypothetical protein T484DRAFT_1898198 [Baffinella frigidus]|nr:hypothetical protein T484DRAFT_1898198 [Cryptophyta sp. CCMP2293]
MADFPANNYFPLSTQLKVPIELPDGTTTALKVPIELPDGTTTAVAYEPTRGLGHGHGQFMGVIPAPSVSVTEIEDGDIILIASDGLWNALGGRRANGDTDSPESADVQGAVLSHLRPLLLKHRGRDPQLIATEVMSLVRTKGFCDNTSLVVVKLTGLGPPPPRGSRSSPGKMQKFQPPLPDPAVIQI